MLAELHAAATGSKMQRHGSRRLLNEVCLERDAISLP